MPTKYQPSQFETNIKELWEKEKVFETNDQLPATNDHKKMYCLSMFPYPSGAGLHVGHVRIYTGTDVMARFFRMKGYSVLHPMGWDAFGLPAENAAIKAKKNPLDMVPGNIANFKKQMQSLGLSYDWSREFATTDPGYYRFTQWLFIQFFKMGLLYKKNTPINFCPSCKTGLAEEEVLPNGMHERCGKPIEKKDLPQWIFRITTYADRLLKDLDLLDWPKGILEMQRNWIGKKSGINVTYEIADLQSPVADRQITCFTTRPDTNFGATFVVIAPEHPLASEICSQKLKVESRKLEEIRSYIEKAKSKSEMEREAEGRKKTGVFTGFYAINPLNGYKMPIWISDFVLMGFGTGAVVGVPGHDLRDFEFAKEFGIPVIRVVVGKDGDKSAITEKKQVQEEEGTMINSGFLDGMDIHTATEKIMDYMEKKKYGTRITTYHLRDWIFSRQRYWGEPIPMVYCKTCAKAGISWIETDEGKTFQKTYQNISKQDKTISKEMAGWFPIYEQSLPLELPYVKSYEPTETGDSPLSTIKEYVTTTCPHCGGLAERETDTMPNWAGSCWYFLRFASPDQSVISNKVRNPASETSERHASLDFSTTSRNDNLEPWKKESLSHWMPVDWYLGGAEHAVLHLLYSRFWVKALQDLGLLDFPEPFHRLRNVGMVLAEDHRKMSKSFGNVINPDDVIKEYGADALRIYEMFMAPFNMEIAWSTKALQGAYRFLNRVWQIYDTPARITGDENDVVVKKLVVSLSKTIIKITNDIQETKFNTSIAAMMEFLNAWETDGGALPKSEAKKFIQILSPFAPFIAEKIWRTVLKEKSSVCVSDWPVVDEKNIKETEISLPVQVNGKVRGVLVVSISASKEDIETMAKENEKIKSHIDGKNYKLIYVPGKILNFVVKG